jgi:hypothetical protein
MRESSPPSKASSTLCHRSEYRKRPGEPFTIQVILRSFRFDRRPSFLDFPAKENPLPKVRVLGLRRKSVAEKKRASFGRPALFELVKTRRRRFLVSQRNIAPRMPRLLNQLFCLKLTLQAESLFREVGSTTSYPPDSVGRDGAAAPGNNHYVTTRA